PMTAASAIHPFLFRLETGSVRTYIFNCIGFTALIATVAVVDGRRLGMSTLVMEPTAQAAWQRLVKEAEARLHCQLDEEQESYLVFLLMRYLTRPDIVKTILALRFLEALGSSGRLRQDRLQNVADQCLIYSGFFPEQAQRRRVRIGYFVDLGRSAYMDLATNGPAGTSRLFASLAEAFVTLIDLLRAMRQSGQRLFADALQAAETWAETGSRLAFEELRRHTDSLP